MARHTSLWISAPIWSTGAMSSCHRSRPERRTLSLFCSDWGLKNLNTTWTGPTKKRRNSKHRKKLSHCLQYCPQLQLWLTWNTTKMQRMMHVSPLTMAFSIMSQMLLKWRASMGCCLPSKAPRGKLLLLAASRLSWWIHIAPTWWSSWLITSPVATVSSVKRKVWQIFKCLTLIWRASGGFSAIFLIYLWVLWWHGWHQAYGTHDERLGSQDCTIDLCNHWSRSRSSCSVHHNMLLWSQWL